MTTTQTKRLKLERTFTAAPKELYNAWVDPEIYAKWLNPAPGMDLVIHDWDARVGGKVSFDMPQPDGNRNPQTGVFHELQPYDRIVTGNPDKSFLIEVDFIPQDGTTTMRVTVTGLPSEWHEPATQGWNAGFDKLEKVLSKGT